MTTKDIENGKDQPSDEVVVFLQTGDSKVPTENTNKEDVKWRDFGLVMIALDILLLIFVIAIAIVWKQEVGALTQDETSKLCLPCDQIKLHKDDDTLNRKQFINKKENGVDICCADSEEKLDKLVEIVCSI